MKAVPIVPYAQRAPLCPRRLTRKLALSAVKNHSQLSSDASNAIMPVSRNSACTNVWSIMVRVALLGLWCPALCLQLHLHTVACDKCKSHALAYDVADDAYILHGCDLLVVGNGDGEE